MRKENLVKNILVLSILLMVAAPVVYSSCGTLDITDEYIPGFHANVPASFRLAPWGGTAAEPCSVCSGTLPPGLSMSSSGVISGTPTTAGEYLVCFTLTDSVGCHTTKCIYVEVYTP